MKYTLVKAIVLFVLCDFTYPVVSSPTDSLYRVVYESNDLDYIKGLIPVYQKEATDEALGKLYFLVAWKYKNVGNIGKSFDYFNLSCKLYHKIRDLDREQKCYENLGGLALRLGQYGKANKYYRQAWEINKKLGDKKETALSLLDIAITLSKIPDSKPEAIWYLTQSADLLLQAEEYKWLSKVYLQMGVIHKELGAYGNAMDCYSNALKHSPKSDEIEAMVLNNQSNVLQLQRDYESALLKQDAAITIKRKLGNDRLLISSLNTLGVIHYKMGNYEKAYDALLESFTINSNQKGLKQHSYRNLHESYIYMDSVCMALGDESRLLENGVLRILVSKESMMINNLESYRVKDLAFQGELIEEKEELAAQRVFIYKLLIAASVLILIAVGVSLVLFLTIKRFRYNSKVLKESIDAFDDNFDMTYKSNS